MEVTADFSDVGTRGGSMQEGEANMVQGMYQPIPICLQGEVTYHTTTYNTTQIVTWKCTRNNDTHRGYV